MKRSELASLCCPVCHGRLDCASVHRQTESEDIRDGVLACAGCGERYPVLDWIARLVAPESRDDAERSLLQRDPGPLPQVVPSGNLDPDERRAAMEEKVREKIFGAGVPAVGHACAEQDCE